MTDSVGYEAECKQGVDLGFDGKTLIHPNQIEVANLVYSPNENDVKKSKDIIEQYNNSQGGAIKGKDGKLIEELHYKKAMDVLKIVEAINNKKT